MKKLPGYYRFKKGNGFTYKTERGLTVVSKSTQTWIDSLAIPPAWQDVWISKNKQAFLLSTGHDKKDKKQYIYHPRWEDIREEKKLLRLTQLGKALPKIRKKLEKDLQSSELSRERVLAAVIKIIDTTGVRIGNDIYAQENHSYGVTTLRKKHVHGKSEKVFEYTGKSSVEQEVHITDNAVVSVIQECEDVPGLELFKYFDSEGNKHNVTSDEVNEYIHHISGQSITAKDFRTWYGSLVALERCRELGDCSEECLPKHMKTIFTTVAKALGNTPKVAADSYVHAAVVDAHIENRLLQINKSATKWRSGEEEILYELLQAYEEAV